MSPFDALETIASRTWHAIPRFRDRGIRLGEDTITSLALDYLATLGRAFFVAEDRRRDESECGCDFELWIGRRGLGWQRYAIQAKKVHFRKQVGRYDSISHTVGGERQIDTLERYAKQNRARAIYCLFNHDSGTKGWNCGLDEDREQLGWTVVPTAVMKKALDGAVAKTFEAIHAEHRTLPFRCLMRCEKATCGIHSSGVSVDESGESTGKAMDVESTADESNLYATLPDALGRLRENNKSRDFAEIGLFEQSSKLYPKRIVLIDASMDNGRSPELGRDERRY